ncbi:non-hydrolyzing UDP-N-acetylglucosamine 2-epimerase [Dethiobacter alkaliphilus]|uniref:non-hydrolyzing UDP-N-acetylglucosamine 2-epimerase n=1 Tax=Dethiobacter alkaliphilus TaxID=427926 RepID=UPI002227B27B|nr:UDP-N-acetylglucosamine 2-epimerase (non-hydrolyzing) [Dethiobacter alkaliphilus]MCW3489261.1 UDP-N-acetylglucosamine 2-epimerase (non-hydrolyzing) [Dethiobacter alkaliphilus]
MLKTLTVFGTRPEAIKMAPLIKKLETEPAIRNIVCVTAQHREMLDMVLNQFCIKPNYDLDLMSNCQSITEITLRTLRGLQTVLHREKPDAVLVHGDTTTTFTASLAAFYEKIPVGHIEAGLRSWNIYSPYPEEMNRRLVGAIAGLHFAPTEGNKQNLLQCGIEEKNIFVTGNTVIDALRMMVSNNFIFPNQLLNQLDYSNKKVILLTAHRRENWGENLKNIFSAVKDIVLDHSDTEVIFPVHPNPAVKDLADKLLEKTNRIHLIPPLDYKAFTNLLSRCYLVLTDSGGIQEEAPSLGKPVLVLRTETERPEAVEAGTVKMAGVNRHEIYRQTTELITDKKKYKQMSQAVNPYGDGRAAERIAAILKQYLEGRP